MIDPKLAKQLKKFAEAGNGKRLGAEFYRRAVETVQSGTDCLIPAPPSIEKINLGPHLVLELTTGGKRVLYAAPERTLTMYRLFGFKSVSEGGDTAILTRMRQELRETPRLTIQSFESLACDFPDSSGLMDVLIFDETEYLEEPECGGIIEGCVAGASKEVPLILMISPYSNMDRIVPALERIREKPAAVLDPEIEKSRIAPAFVTSGWELLPLTDNRRIATKTKRMVKETKPFRQAGPGKMVNTLVSKLRTHRFTPALILFEKPEQCESAVEESRKEGDKAGKILTDPRVVTILDRNPDLKDHPHVTLSLSRRAAPYHEDQHPYWGELVELFVHYGAADIVFATPKSAADLSTRFKSAVFIETGGDPTDGEDWISPLEADRIIRLMGGAGPDKTALMIAAHTRDIDLAFYKDLFTAPHRPLDPSFGCDSRSVLKLLSAGAPEDGSPEKSLSRAIRREWGRFCVDALQNGLRMELPEARCHVHIKVIRSLIDLHLKLSKDINRFEFQLAEKRPEGRSSVRKHLENARRAMSMLPCESCPHHDTCHKRGPKKFRALLRAYDESAELLAAAKSGLELDFSLATACLKEFGMVDAHFELTPFGRFGMKTGIAYPQFLCDALKAGRIPFDGQNRKVAVSSGFLEPVAIDHSEIPNKNQEAFERAEAEYENLRPVIDSTAERLLRFGLLQPGYHIQNAVFMFEYQQTGDIESVSGKLGVSAGRAVRFLKMAQHLADSLERDTAAVFGGETAMFDSPGGL